MQRETKQARTCAVVVAAVGVAAEVRLIGEDAHVGEVLWGTALEEDLKVASVVQLELGGRLWHARVKQVKGRAGRLRVIH